MEAFQSAIARWRVHEAKPDHVLLPLAREGDEAAVRALVKRYNQRLFRVARGVVSTDAEAEDVVQETYARAFTHLDGFRGEAAFSTWLIRIALNEANGRLRRQRHRQSVGTEELDTAQFARGEVVMFPTTPPPADPESDAGREQVRRVLEQAVAKLPEPFRLVFLLRDVEGLSTREVADLLAIPSETVKTRLHRARRLLREALEEVLSPRFSEVFPFAGARCARVADRAVERLRHASADEEGHR